MGIKPNLNKPSSYTDETKNKAIEMYFSGQYTKLQICKLLRIKSVYTFRDWVRAYKTKHHYGIIPSKKDIMASDDFKKSPDGKEFQTFDVENMSTAELKKAVKQLEFERDCQNAIAEVLKKELS